MKASIYYNEYIPLSPISDMFMHFNGFLDAYVFDVFTSLVSVYSSTIDNIFLLYILLYLIAIMRGAVQSTLMHNTFHLIMVTFVYTMLYQWHALASHIYDLIVTGPADIVLVIMSVIRSNVPGDTSVGQILVGDGSGKNNITAGVDYYFNKGIRIQGILWSQGSWTSRGMSLLVLLVVILLSVQSTGMLIYSQVTIALLLSIAPIFMLFLLFKNTRGWMEGWLRMLMTMMMLQILTLSMLAMSLSIMSYALIGMSKALARGEFDYGTLTPFLLIALTTSYMLKQLWGVAAMIGGGFAAKSWSAYADSGGFIRGTKAGISATATGVSAASAGISMTASGLRRTGRAAKSVGKNL